MTAFEKQGGVSFLLIYYTGRHMCYYLRYKEMMRFWKRMEEGGPKSFRFEELSGAYFVPSSGGTALHYLKCMDKDLRERSMEKDQV